MKLLLERLCSMLAACALFAIMWLTLVDVTGRKFASASVTGSLELTELMMVVVIFAGLPLVSLRGEHVVFDSLDALLPPAVVRVQCVLVNACCALALGGVAWLMWIKGAQLMEYGDTTAQLRIPQGPFVFGMSVLCGVTAIVHLLLMFTPVAHHHPGVAADDAAAGP
jgi:TRAP-type C4-dicarboxylate transport system permease small subunit